jgi:hypothetical protein
MGPDAGIPSWALFALPLVIATTIISGILFGGPAVGFLAATIIAGLIVVAAIRAKPGERTPARSGAGEPGMEEARENGWRAAAVRRALIPLALAAAAVVVIAVSGGTARVIGWGLLAVAVAVAMSLIFLEVGYSEDRARARAERRRGSGRSGP